MTTYEFNFNVGGTMYTVSFYCTRTVPPTQGDARKVLALLMGRNALSHHHSWWKDGELYSVLAQISRRLPVEYYKDMELAQF